MRYEEIKDRAAGDFQRLTGVKPPVFLQMLAAVQAQVRVFGRPCKLSLADQLLMALMYWREYRSMFHISHTYGVSEPTVHRTIHKMERALMDSDQFRLPGKKALLDPEMEWEVILVDATETAVERPQKNKNASTAGRKSATRTKRS